METRVAFIGPMYRSGSQFYDWSAMAEHYATLLSATADFETRTFATFDAAKPYLAQSTGERRMVFLTSERYDPNAVVAATQYPSAKVFVFSEAYPRGAPEVLRDEHPPTPTPGIPLLFALDSITAENMRRLIA